MNTELLLRRLAESSRPDARVRCDREGGPADGGRNILRISHCHLESTGRLRSDGLLSKRAEIPKHTVAQNGQGYFVSRLTIRAKPGG